MVRPISFGFALVGVALAQISLAAPQKGSQADLLGAIAKQERKFLSRPGSGWQAPQPVDNFRAEIDQNGVLRLASDRSAGTALVKLDSYGRGEALTQASRPLSTEVTSDQAGWPLLGFERQGVDEWFVNEERGLHHWVRVTERPKSLLPGPMTVELEVQGSFRPVSTSATSVSLDGAGLYYSGLKVWDANGKVLPARMTTVGQNIRIEVEDMGAVYPVTIDPTWSQQAKLEPFNEGVATTGAANDGIGFAVAISGDYAIVGAPYRDSLVYGDDSGVAYVFERSGTTWSQASLLYPPDSGAGDNFGSSVAISGTTAVVGMPFDDQGFTDRGAAVVFTRTLAGWVQQQKILATDGGAADAFGASVGIDGDTVIVGAYNAPVSSVRAGAAYIFTRSGSVWSQQAKLTGSTATVNGNSFGTSVAVDENTAVVGAPYRNSARGSAYVFTRSSSVWTEQAVLEANDSANGAYLGQSVSLDGNTVGVGAPGMDSSAGAGYVFTRSGTTWSQQAKLTASDAVFGDYFGYSVSVSGNKMAVGAVLDDSPPDSGSVYVFVRNGNSWSQQTRRVASDAVANDYFGYSVGISGYSVVVGALFADAPSTNSGAAYVLLSTTLIDSVTANGPVVGGSSYSGTVNLDDTVGANKTVTLQSSNPSVLSVPASATVLANNSSVNFNYTTASVSTPVTVTITATMDSIQKTVNVMVVPVPALNTLTANDTTFLRGTTATGTVNIFYPAPYGGTVVALSAVNLWPGYAGGSVPASVTIPAGSTSATFPISGALVTGAWQFDVNATLNSVTKTIRMTIMSAFLKSLTATPNNIENGKTLTLTFTSTAAAPATGLVYDLETNNPGQLPMPATVTIPAGQTSTTLDVVVGNSWTKHNTYVRATGADGLSKSVPITTVPPTLQSMAWSPTHVSYNTSSTLTLTSRWPAPPGGFTYTLVSTAPWLVSVPGTVTIPEGETTATVTVNVPSFFRIKAFADVKATTSTGIMMKKRLYMGTW